MEQAIQIIFTVIALGIAIVAIAKIAPQVQESMKGGYNEQAIGILKDRCDFVCTLNTYESQIASIELSSGTVLYGRTNKICFNSTDKVRCQLCLCNVTEGPIVDISSEFAQRAFKSHKYRCHLFNLGNVSINCSI